MVGVSKGYSLKAKSRLCFILNKKQVLQKELQFLKWMQEINVGFEPLDDKEKIGIFRGKEVFLVDWRDFLLKVKAVPPNLITPYEYIQDHERELYTIRALDWLEVGRYMNLPSSGLKEMATYYTVRLCRRQGKFRIEDILGYYLPGQDRDMIQILNVRDILDNFTFYSDTPWKDMRDELKSYSITRIALLYQYMNRRGLLSTFRCKDELQDLVRDHCEESWLEYEEFYPFFQVVVRILR